VIKGDAPGASLIDASLVDAPTDVSFATRTRVLTTGSALPDK
jgi:hypothetical protein